MGAQQCPALDIVWYPFPEPPTDSEPLPPRSRTSLDHFGSQCLIQGQTSETVMNANRTVGEQHKGASDLCKDQGSPPKEGLYNWTFVPPYLCPWESMRGRDRALHFRARPTWL